MTEVWITLESRAGKPLATRSIDPTGMPRGDLIPFESRFHLTTRPSGRLFVTAIAIGPDGIPIDAMRRRFELGTWIDLRAPR